MPVYFLHRYQTEATVKLVGEQDYNYQVKGSGQQSKKPLRLKNKKGIENANENPKSRSIKNSKRTKTIIYATLHGFSKNSKSLLKGKQGLRLML